MFYSDIASFIFKKQFSQTLGELPIDLVVSRNISEKVNITDNPVEAGKFITDHAYDQPVEIDLNCVISDYSIKNNLFSNSILAFGRQPNKIINAKNQLKRLKDAKTPITVATKNHIYTNMLISYINFRESAQTGESLTFDIGFREIQIASSQFVAIDNSKIRTDNAKAKSSFGVQTNNQDDAVAPPVAPSKITLTQFVKNIF